MRFLDLIGKEFVAKRAPRRSHWCSTTVGAIGRPSALRDARMPSGMREDVLPILLLNTVLQQL